MIQLFCDIFTLMIEPTFSMLWTHFHHHDKLPWSCYEKCMQIQNFYNLLHATGEPLVFYYNPGDPAKIFYVLADCYSGIVIQWERSHGEQKKENPLLL